MSLSNSTAEKPHKKARTSPYPGSQVDRSQVPNEEVSWLVEWPEDKPVQNFSPKFNKKDGLVERRSQNSRTGLVGQGLWGLTHSVSGRIILQFVAIKRKDCGQWAIPGGMVDPGEKFSATPKREFGEEAMNSLQKSRADTQELEKQLHKLFSQERFVVYKGYVDDPQNTDNTWMETEAVNYHDETGEVMNLLPLEAGDDAEKVGWVDINDKLKLYASHSQFIQLVAEKRGAH
ncbi:hypothetical protein FD754_012650 [Muntiacus muntjak]|uniref:ADP-ribose pyrophosphatase, mitochondrial n=1 Tax=Muntiacus muntjak TaxID=9888 RepID=A0A5N3VFM5_MUNMU|nr:hypothetical protein FD754_012650 [Muntiacus muntjak]